MVILPLENLSFLISIAPFRPSVSFYNSTFGLCPNPSFFFLSFCQRVCTLAGERQEKALFSGAGSHFNTCSLNSPSCHNFGHTWTRTQCVFSSCWLGMQMIASHVGPISLNYCVIGQDLNFSLLFSNML